MAVLAPDPTTPAQRLAQPADRKAQPADREGRPRPLGALALLIGLAVGVAGAVPAGPAQADARITPDRGRFTIVGSGWGHGFGMSQYGAYGAAQAGMSWRQILDFYYPGTRLSRLPAGNTVRVWITSDTDDDLRVRASRGLTLHSGSRSYRLPRGERYKVWRLVRKGSRYQLSYRSADGRYKNKRVPLGQDTWWLSNSAKRITVLLPNLTRREYRGSVLLVKDGTGGRTVNRVTMENYLRSVVPKEMPTSWATDAVRTQAVAARTYAARMRADAPRGRGYHLCDTPACQVYTGRTVTWRGVRVLQETVGGDRAVAATSGRVLKYGSAYALAQFSSSNGGHTARGSRPYLVPFPDPYDDEVRSQRWTRSITVAAIQARWPSAGSVRQLKVTKRDGHGRWGGRVTEVAIIGSARTVRVSGSAFQWAFGLKSRLFAVS
jgi:stage II sporulation protein D